MKSAPLKLMALAFLAMLILPAASSEATADLEKYLDCLTDKKVDIVFVFDTSGSMGGEINELSATARDFAGDLEASRIDYRLGLVEFRDFPQSCGESKKTSCGEPDDFAYKVKGNGNLTKDISIFSSWLRELKASGGADGPESILAALRHTTSDCQWRSDAEKVIIVVTDAPPHSDGDCCNAEGDTLDGTIFGLTDQGARVHIIGPEDAPLRRIAGETGGQFFKIRSGLSLKPLLKEITGAMSCSFKVEAETACLNRTLEAKVLLVGKEAIPFVAGQTEAWMYLDQAGSKSRYNLSYDQAAGAYLAKVPEVCGPVELTVYGRVGERSAVQSVQVECGNCGAPAEAEEGASNQPPEITSLAAEPRSPQEKGTAVTWTIDATDPNGDQLLYRFFLDDEPMTDWTEKNSWTWVPNNASLYRIEVQVRDGKHAGPSGMDDRESGRFEITATVPVMKPLAPTKTWQKTFGGTRQDEARSVRQTSDGGYILAGFTESYGANSNNDDLGDMANAWLIKTDALGNEVWNRTFGGMSWDYVDSVQQTSDGGYILTGWTNSSDAGFGVVWLIKTDAEGNEVWSKTLGEKETGYADSVRQTSDRGYILAGATRPPGAWNRPALLIKTDAEGNEVWKRILSRTVKDSANSVQQTSDGGYILAGETYSSGEDAWLIKTDAEGNEVWSRTFGGPNVDSASSVQQARDGGYILAGIINSSFGVASGNAWLIKTDAEGSEVWNKTLGLGEINSVHSVQQTSDGGYILGGVTNRGSSDYYSGDAWLIKTDPNGNEIWSRTFGGPNLDLASSVQQTSDGGYILAGTTNSSLGGWSGDVWLIKTDAEGRSPSSPDGN